MKNQAFYARLRNARSFLRFCQDTHSELSVLKKDGTIMPFNAGAVASWSKWASTGTFKTTGKALTRRERKRLARRLFSTRSYLCPGITRSQAFALAKNVYPRKAVTIHHSALCKSSRSYLPYWMTTGVVVCTLVMKNDRIKRKTISNKGWAPFPGWWCGDRTLASELRASEYASDNGSKVYLSGVTADQTAEVPTYHPVAGPETTKLKVNLEDPDSVADSQRAAKCILDRL